MLDYGPSQQDQRHRFVFSGIFIAPWDIRLSSITTIASGRPYNILAGFDFNQDGDATNDRARRNPNATPNDYTTTVGKNTGIMPYQAFVDVRASRKFRVTERVQLEAILEVFNLFNRTNFTEINNVFGRGVYPTNPLPTFGQFTQAAAPRQTQLALKLSF
jgi:outer membrane receptor for Fe3+-dicitrate